MATGFVYYPDFLEHDTGPSHPERAERLRSVMAHLESNGLLLQLTRLEATACEERWLHSVHTEDHVELVRRAASQAPVHLDPDTVVSACSWDVARLARGSLLAACDAVVDGRVDNAFCASRPPGHHAERDHAMGFCLFNHVAVAARYLQQQHSIDRVMIIDWDVHHGNGTEDILRKVDDTAFFSIHQHPAYPGTGTKSFDNCHNFTVAPDSSNLIWRKAASAALAEMKKFDPDLICVSAGFDAYKRDPLCQQKLEIEDFTWIAQQLRQLEKPQANLLEGGYSNDLPKLIFAYLKGLLK